MSRGHQIFAITTGDVKKNHCPIIDEETRYDGVRVIYCSRRRFWLPFYSPRLKTEVSARVSDYQAAIIRSSWTSVGPTASAVCRTKKVPYLAYPEGNFDQWCMRRSFIKKKLFWQLLDKKYFAGAACVVALTKFEADSILRMGLSNRIEIIPNGIDSAEYVSGQSRGQIEDQYPQLKGRRWILYLGRIHPKKGLLNLVQAFGSIKQKHPDAFLVFAGPDDGNYRRIVEHVVYCNDLTNDVLFTGQILGRLKIGFLMHSYLMALPSFSEGFPITVLEALSCGLPVVLTPGCHVPEIASERAGLEVENSPDRLAEAMRVLLDDEACRNDLGLNGRRLFNERYSLKNVTSMTLELLNDLIA